MSVDGDRRRQWTGAASVFVLCMYTTFPVMGDEPKKDPAPAANGPAPAADADESKQAALALKARSVFKQYCHRCHHGAGSAGGEKFDVLDHASLLDSGAVVAGDPDSSNVWIRHSKGDMPPKEVAERPSFNDSAALKAWIEAGAPAYPEAQGRKPIARAEVLSAVLGDLRALEPEDRPFRRYFHFEHLHNDLSVPEEDLDLIRAALSKAVNSLSWKRRISPPKPVDVPALVLAIDTRDYDWDQKDLWREVLIAYPYGVRYKHDNDPALAKLDEEIALLTGCGLPLVRADWFVATATRPGLYHTLLQLPTHAGDLEHRLGVDVLKNFERDRLARAGFFPSGVSGQNRLVERHDSQHGAYWKSYDFRKTGERNDLKKHPLGPDFPSHPYPHQSFLHDGGEIIWHLPNGLQGYMLVDGKDRRIDAGPIDVVGDALKTSGTNEIITGVSCMACHKTGMIPFTDHIREGSAIFGGAKEKMQKLYPPKATMDKLVDDDSKQFLQALEQAVGPFLRRGANKNTDITDFREPVGEVARIYALKPLGADDVASELGLANADDLQKKMGERRMKELGLAPLVTGGKIERRFWESKTGLSLFQRCARELGATPYNEN